MDQDFAQRIADRMGWMLLVGVTITLVVGILIGAILNRGCTRYRVNIERIPEVQHGK